MEQTLIRLEWNIHTLQEHIALILHHLLPRCHRTPKRTSQRRDFGTVSIHLWCEVAFHFGNLAADCACEVLLKAWEDHLRKQLAHHGSGLFKTVTDLHALRVIDLLLRVD